MYDIREEMCLDAWRSGAKRILESKGKILNLITEIQMPHKVHQSWISDYSPHSVVGTERITDVIDTIFPVSLYARYPVRAELYSRYLACHTRAMRWKRNRSRWGTYFGRLIAFGETNPVNQLERVIIKLNSWRQTNRTGLVFHLSSPVTDAPRTRGGPCWHFGEILWHSNNVIDLVVVYRNHDYFNKALGNFIGLGQLLNFIASASGKNPGKLICHSVQAYSDKPMKYLKALAHT